MSRSSLVERVLGVTDLSNIDRAMSQAHATLSGEAYLNPYDPALNYPTQDGMLQRWYDGLPKNSQERFLALAEVENIIVRRKPDTANTLVDWPIYSGMMHQFGKRADGNATALMIGGLTSLSSRSFQCLAEDEYGATTTIVVDPVGGTDKARHGLFVYGSGLALPIADASMDFVHTNQLLHKLVDPSSKTASEQYKLRALVAEMARVMAPGAQLLMKEIIPNHKDIDSSTERGSIRAINESTRLSTSIARMLLQHGIESVATGIAVKPRGYDFLFDEERDFGRFQQNVFPAAFTVFARKRSIGQPIAL